MLILISKKGTSCFFLKINVTIIPLQKSGESMTINDIAEIRTGLVMTRKKATGKEDITYKYKALNLKCLADEGCINTNLIDKYESTEELKSEYFTHKGDILVRLSTPYTVVLIGDTSLCGLIVPSHYAIVRVNPKLATPEYLFWSLRRDKNQIRLIQDSSGSTVLGTISSGLIGRLPIKLLPLKDQNAVGHLMILSEREQELLHRLADEKKKYNTLMLKNIYETMKRGKQI